MTLRLGSLAAALPALLISLPASVAARPAARTATPSADAAPPARSAPLREELVDAASLADVARAGSGLRLGDRLHLEGLALEPAGAPVGLDLERFEVFAPDGKVVVHGQGGETERPFPAHAYFRGRVIGEPDSVAVLSILADGGVRGIVQRDGGVWELGEGPVRADGGKRLAARRAEAPEAAAEGFECAADQLVPPPESTGASAIPGSGESAAPGTDAVGAISPAATSTAYTARVAVETDYELYQNRFGGNRAALESYIGDLFAYASTVYDAEVSTNLVVSHLSVWTTSGDPYSLSGTCGLYELGRYWNDNRTGVSRTITHMVSGKSQQSGVAWVGVLCNGAFTVNHGGACPTLAPQIDNYGGAYGFSGGVSGSFDPASPSPVWDIVEVSHEIGHNFNSPHTHCYNGIGGSSSPVDPCYNGEAANGCYSGATSLPGPAGAGSGTLMSYCHLKSPGLSNISLTFGTGHPYGVLPQRVPDRMRAHVEAVAAAAPACLARTGGGGGGGGTCDDLTLSSQTVTSTQTFEACGTLSAGNGFTVAVSGPELVTLRAGTVVLRSGFSVRTGARLRLETQ